MDKETQQEKARRAAGIKSFKNTDFSDCPELTDEQLAQIKPYHYRNMKKQEQQEDKERTER